MTITISGETLEDVKQQIRNIEALFSTWTVAPEPIAQPPQVVQAHATTEENSGVPYCVHGLMKWREGTTKAGAEYAGHYCTAKEQADQCRTVFPKKKPLQIPADRQNVDYNDPLR